VCSLLVCQKAILAGRDGPKAPNVARNDQQDVSTGGPLTQKPMHEASGHVRSTAPKHLITLSVSSESRHLSIGRTTNKGLLHGNIADSDPEEDGWDMLVQAVAGGLSLEPQMLLCPCTILGVYQKVSARCPGGNLVRFQMDSIPHHPRHNMRTTRAYETLGQTCRQRQQERLTIETKSRRTIAFTARETEAW
jgi:hypothetical protein